LIVFRSFSKSYASYAKRKKEPPTPKNAFELRAAKKLAAMERAKLVQQEQLRLEEEARALEREASEAEMKRGAVVELKSADEMPHDQVGAQLDAWKAMLKTHGWDV
jgi:hypothetical protein